MKLPKTFMMISNWKNLLVSIVYTKNYNIQRFKGEKQGVKNVPNFVKHPSVGPIIYKRKLRPSLFGWVYHLFYGYNDFWLLNIGFQWAISSIKKIKVRVYSLLSSLQTYHPTLHLPPPPPLLVTGPVHSCATSTPRSIQSWGWSA